jgi:hypothetical protein
MVPIVALAIATGPGIVARGYISYPTSIFIYVGAGYLIYRLGDWRHGKRVSPLFGAVLWVAAVGWNLGYLLGAIAPLKIYFYGLTHYLAGLRLPDLFHVPQVMSLTGREITPRLFFGPGTFAEAGVMPCAAHSNPVSDPSYARALMIRAPFLLLSGTALAFMFPRQKSDPCPSFRWKLSLGWCVLIAVAGSALLTYPLRSQSFPLFCTFGLSGTAGSTLRYEIDLAPQFVDELEKLPPTITRLEVIHGFRALIRPGGPVRAALLGERLRIELSEVVPQVERDPILEALRRFPSITLEVTFDSDPAMMVLNGGWQRNNLPGRRLRVDGQLLTLLEQPILPVFEIRARRARAVFLPDLIGF